MPRPTLQSPTEKQDAAQNIFADVSGLEKRTNEIIAKLNPAFMKHDQINN
jgi:hypothetical protein